MNLNLKPAALVLGSLVFIVPAIPSAFADTETTTTKTTTITNEGQTIVLPTTTTYAFIDPITGTIRGNFEPTAETVDIQTCPVGTAIIDQATGKIVATVNPSGHIIDIITAPAFDPLAASIDDRFSDLNRAINTAADNGSITAAQSRSLRADLDRVGTRKANDTSRGKFLTYAESIFLASKLNDIGDRLAFLTRANAMAPIIATRFVNANGQVFVAIDDIDFRRIKLGQRVDDEFIAGRLSSSQGNQMRDQLASAADRESQCKRDKRWTADEKDAVTAKLDSVESSLNRAVASK